MTAGGQPVTGTNIISIIPGSTWGTKEDKVLIVGAHWDTVVGSPGEGQMLLSNKYMYNTYVYDRTLMKLLQIPPRVQ